MRDGEAYYCGGIPGRRQFDRRTPSPEHTCACSYVVQHLRSP